MPAPFDKGAKGRGMRRTPCGYCADGGPLGTAAPTDEVRHIRPYESDVTWRFSNTLRNIKIEFNDTD